MNMNNKGLNLRILKSLLITISVVLVAGLVSITDVYKSIEYNFNNTTYRMAGITKSNIDEIIIVTIDDLSLIEAEKLGIYWPWSRDMYAYLSEYMINDGARAVLFDVIFTGPDLDRSTSIGAENDAKFHEVMVNTDRLVIGFNVDNRFERSDILNVKPISNASTIRNVSKFKYLFAPHEPFRENNSNFGFVDINADLDGAIREYKPLVEIDGKFYPSLALAGLLAAGDKGMPESFKLNERGNFILKWYGPGGVKEYDENEKLKTGVFNYMSAWHVFGNAIQYKYGRATGIEPGTFKDKYVIVGSSARSLFDMRQTPYTVKGAAYPGVEVHATALANMINRERKIPVSKPLQLIIFSLIIFLLAFWGLNTKHAGRYSLVFALILSSLIFIFGVVFIRFDLVFESATYITSMVTAFIFIIIFNYISIGKNRNALRKTFGTYMHPELIKKLVDSEAPVSTSGESVNATALFIDIEGFTTFSEKNTPEKVVEVLNKYLDKFSDIVIRNKGYVNKFLGDGLMALFGSPEHYENHADMAVKSAIECYEANKQLCGDHGLNIRIGINTGKMIAGSMGGMGKKLEFTAIGDSVNTASRLEGANKFFETKILAGEYTYRELTDKNLLNFLGYFSLKGKDVPIGIYFIGEFDEAYMKSFKQLIIAYETKDVQEIKRIKDLDYKNGPIRYYIELYERNPDSIGKPVKLSEK